MAPSSRTLRSLVLWAATTGCFALALSLWPTGVGATVATRLSRQELVRQANLIVHAIVESRAVVPTRGEHGEIRTRSTLRVLRTLEGQSRRTVVVQQLGGTLGDLTMHVEGNARLEPGDEVVVFLDHDTATGLSYVIGMAQGLFLVNRADAQHPVVERDLTGIAFYEAVSGPPMITPGRHELAEGLDHLLADIARLVRAERGTR